MHIEWEARKQAQSGANLWKAPRPANRFRTLRAHKDRARLYLLLLLTVFSLLLFGCPLYNPAAFIQHQTAPDDISSIATQATLQWDPPASGASQVVSYTVSYRIHGTSTWNTLATVPASPQPEYMVLRAALGSGSFDFAVAAVDSTGALSPLHTSLDPTADPTTGWYLTWGP